MSDRIHLTGQGFVSPFGVGAAALRAGLAGGRSCLRHRVRTPGEDGGAFAADAPPARSRGGFEASVPDAATPEGVPVQGLRRAPAHVRHGVVACAEALRSSLREVPPERRGLVFASSLGSPDFSYRLWHGLLRSGKAGASPSHFSEGVPNGLTGHLARLFQILGAGHMLHGGTDAGLRALALGRDALRAGRADQVVVGATEELTEVVQRGYRAFGLMQERSPDEGPAGLTPGEGAAAFVLEREADAVCGGPPPLAAVGAIASTQLDGLRDPGAVPRLVAMLRRVLGPALFDGEAPVAISFGGSRNGTPVDAVEERLLAELAADQRITLNPTFRVKELCGEAFAVTPLWQVAEAIDRLRTHRFALVFSLSFFGAATAVLLEAPREGGRS